MVEMVDTDRQFTALFHEFYPCLCRFLSSMLGDVRRAEELAQEGLLRLYLSPMKEAPRDEARNWVFRVVRNLALNERKRAANSARLARWALRSEARDAPSAELALQRKQELALVWRLVLELPEQQRAALLLREHEAMSYADIARVLGISLENVKVSIFRARRYVREGWRREVKR